MHKFPRIDMLLFKHPPSGQNIPEILIKFSIFIALYLVPFHSDVRILIHDGRKKLLFCASLNHNLVLSEVPRT